MPPLTPSPNNNCMYYTEKDKAEALASHFEKVHKLTKNLGFPNFNSKVERCVDHYLQQNNDSDEPELTDTLEIQRIIIM